MKPRCILHEKTQRFLRGRRDAHVHVRPGAFYTRKHSDFSAVGGGLRRGCILIRNRDGAVFRFLQLAHAMNATVLMGWCGVGLCQGSTDRTKNNKCRSFPPSLPLHTYTRLFAHNIIADDVCSVPPVPQITSFDTYTCITLYIHRV